MSDPFRPGNLIALYNLNNRKLLSSCPITCWSWSVIPERTFSLVKDYNIKLDANDIFRIHDLGLKKHQVDIILDMLILDLL
jgi:hypothetical protein